MHMENEIYHCIYDKTKRNREASVFWGFDFQILPT